MAGRIPQSFIDELLSRIDIVDVIDGYVPLKKAGKNHQACCPFHNEKTPSFTVSQEKQFYHCFGCGANGTAISFLMEYSGMSFPEAVEELAHRCGLPIPKEAAHIEIDKDRAELYELMEMITRFYSKQLKEHSESATAIEYLKNRGLTGEIAKQFEIGFAPPGWDNLLNNFGQSNEAKARLEKIGMTIKKDNGGFYDRFRNRIVFPIRDVRNRVIGFGGRVLSKDDTPKYLNSPETILFHKGYELYGLYQARKAAGQKVYIVEGYMDVVSLAQFGVNNAVATLGTAATAEQIEKLFKKFPQIVFCFDGDKAGIKAAWRALETTLPLLKDGRQCHFLFIPEGEDPDSFVRQHGKEGFERPELLMPLSDYLFQQLEQDLDLSTAEGRASYVEKAKPFVQKLQTSAFRELIVAEISKRSGVNFNQFEPQASSKPRTQTTTTRPRVKNPKLHTMTPVRRAIRMLLNHPEIAKQTESLNELSHLKEHGIPFLLELIQYIQNRESTTIANIMEHWRDTPTEKALMDLARSEELLNEPDELIIEFNGLLKKMILDAKKQERQWQSQGLKNLDDLKKLQESNK